MLAVVAYVRRADLLCCKRMLTGISEAVVQHRLFVLRVEKHATHGDRINRRGPQNRITKPNKKPRMLRNGAEMTSVTT